MTELILFMTLYCGVTNSCEIELISAPPIVLKIQKHNVEPVYLICDEKTEVQENLEVKSLTNCRIETTLN